MGYALNVLYLAVIAVCSPWLLWRSLRTGRYREGWREKLLGRLAPISGPKPTLWFHAVSVGEVQALRSLILLMSQSLPEYPILITTTTRTGLATARGLFPEHSVQYAPLDFTWAVKNALRRARPSLLVLVELELWPNWIREADRLGVKIALVNGRLSERSCRGYRRIGWIVRPLLRRLSWIAVQDSVYAERFVQLGATPTQVTVTGSMKFDGAESDHQHAEILLRKKELQLRRDDRVILCGSTQAPEEAMALQAFSRLRERHSNLRLILVPRHPERFATVAQLIDAYPVRWLKRSQMGKGAVDPNWEVLLVDTIGELRWFWGLAELGFVGGSFGNRGGQNMIEPAAFGVCTCFGPNTWNFKDIVEQLLKADAATVLRSPSEFHGWLEEMIDRRDIACAFGERARKFVAAQRGATERTVEALIQLLSSSERIDAGVIPEPHFRRRSQARIEVK